MRNICQWIIGYDFVSSASTQLIFLVAQFPPGSSKNPQYSDFTWLNNCMSSAKCDSMELASETEAVSSELSILVFGQQQVVNHRLREIHALNN